MTSLQVVQAVTGPNCGRGRAPPPKVKPYGHLSELAGMAGFSGFDHTLFIPVNALALLSRRSPVTAHSQHFAPFDRFVEYGL